MKKEDIKNQTTENLKAEHKKLKGMSQALGGLLILLLVTSIFGAIIANEKTTFIALIVVAISLGAILPSTVSMIKSINAELALREGNDVSEN